MVVNTYKGRGYNAVTKHLKQVHNTSTEFFDFNIGSIIL